MDFIFFFWSDIGYLDLVYSMKCVKRFSWSFRSNGLNLVWFDKILRGFGLEVFLFEVCFIE